MSDTSMQEIKLFYCYAREDIAFRDKLEIQLGSLKHQYCLSHWSDREIVPGENWEQTINKHLDTADIILLLISPYFIASEYCYGKEMQRALRHHHEGTCRIIPILVRPTSWKDTPIGSIQVLPTNAKPITRWANRDDAYFNIVEGINNSLKSFKRSYRPQEDEEVSISLKTKEEWLEEGITLNARMRYDDMMRRLLPLSRPYT
jgi:hypothetical protein